MATYAPGSSQRVVTVSVSGEFDRIGIFSLRAVSTGDVIDLSTIFLDIRRAGLVGVTVAGVLSMNNQSGTSITLGAGVANDAAVLTVYGVPA